MIVFLLDLAMVSVVILLAYVLHVSQWVLTDLRPDGERGICGFADPAVWWKGVRGWDNFVLVDSCLLQVSRRHWAWALSSLGLCCHLPALLVLFLVHQLSPEALHWRGELAAAGGVLLALVIAAAASWYSIGEFHDLMAESFSFVAAVRTFLRGRFSEAEQNAVLHLAFKLLEMADQVVPKIYDTTPEGGREALLDVLAMLNDTGDWTQRISPEERELYEKLSEFL